MTVSKKGDTKDVYALNEVKKVTFTDVQCITGIKDNLIIKTFNKFKNYPNPFSNATTIELQLNKPASTVIDIYNMQGMLVKELLNSNLSTGIHKINWNGQNSSGNRVTSGLYFYQVKVNNEIYSNKMFLIN
jgi:hypothetical protein